MGFKLNRAGMERLQRELEEKFLGGLQVPKGGSEEDAVRSVRDQLEQLGVQPNGAEVRKMVREVRGR